MTIAIESAADRYQHTFARWQAARNSGRTRLQDSLAIELGTIAQEIDPLGENEKMLMELRKSAWERFWRNI